MSYLTPFIFISIILILLNKNIEKLKQFLTIFGFCLSLIMFWDLFKIFEKKYQYLDQKEISRELDKNDREKEPKVEIVEKETPIDPIIAEALKHARRARKK